VPHPVFTANVGIAHFSAGVSVDTAAGTAYFHFTKSITPPLTLKEATSVFASVGLSIPIMRDAAGNITARMTNAEAQSIISGLSGSASATVYPGVNVGFSKTAETRFAGTVDLFLGKSSTERKSPIDVNGTVTSGAFNLADWVHQKMGLDFSINKDDPAASFNDLRDTDWALHMRYELKMRTYAYPSFFFSNNPHFDPSRLKCEPEDSGKPTPEPNQSLPQ
jgi:hypothetical protein